MLNHKLVRLFTTGNISMVSMEGCRVYAGPSSLSLGMNLIEWHGAGETLSFHMRDLHEYENNKEFYNSKLYKHLAGYNDEET